MKCTGCAGCVYGVVADGVMPCARCSKLIICADTGMYVHIWFSFYISLLFLLSLLSAHTHARLCSMLILMLVSARCSYACSSLLPRPTATHSTRVVKTSDGGFAGVLEQAHGAAGHITVLTVTKGRVEINPKVRLIRLWLGTMCVCVCVCVCVSCVCVCV